jgi:hypothetical protein
MDAPSLARSLELKSRSAGFAGLSRVGVRAAAPSQFGDPTIQDLRPDFKPKKQKKNGSESFRLPSH